MQNKLIYSLYENDVHSTNSNDKIKTIHLWFTNMFPHLLCHHTVLLMKCFTDSEIFSYLELNCDSNMTKIDIILVRADWAT